MFFHMKKPLCPEFGLTRQNYPEVTISCTSSNEVDWAIIQGQLLLSSSLPYPSYNSRVILSWSQTEQEVNVTFEVNNVRKWGFPFNRMDHIDCVMWFQRPPDSTINRCGKCRDLGYYLKKGVQHRKSVTPERKARRVLPSSKYPISNSLLLASAQELTQLEKHN